MDKVKVAIMYDFDKTLSVKDMQEFTFIPALGYEKASDFWQEVTKITNDNKMDAILSYLYYMLRKSNEKNIPIRPNDFKKLGENIEFFPGVETWFDRINAIGEKLGLEIEHYIISSGLSEIIEGTCIADKFKKIYACKYLYDVNEVAVWPALVVNYTTKTQYLFRINKQILDENNDIDLNTALKNQKRPIPFERMIYLGDGITDIPCMKLVKEYGGKSIVVYPQDNLKKADDAKVYIRDQRANYMAPANYMPNEKLENLIHKILINIRSKYELEIEEESYIEE